mgnify:CR=1 FL=1
MMYDLLETAIHAAQDARQAILAIEATSTNRNTLDAAFNALGESIQQLSRLLEPVEAE